jgi:hypothetical protein
MFFVMSQMISLMTMSIGHDITGIIYDIICDAISDVFSHVTVTFFHDVVGDITDRSDVIQSHVIRHTSLVIRHTSFVTQSLTLKPTISVTFQ